MQKELQNELVEESAGIAFATEGDRPVFETNSTLRLFLSTMGYD